MRQPWNARFKRLFALGIHRPDRTRNDADVELESLIDERIERFVALGMSPDNARAEAIDRLGGSLEGARSRVRRSAAHRDDSLRQNDAIDGLRDDLRLALRGLRREPMFAGFVIVTLALAIGANAAMFGVVDKLLLQGPAHVHAPGELRRLYWTVRGAAGEEQTTSAIDPRLYANIAAETRAFAGLAMYTRSGKGLQLGEGETARPIWSASSTANFLSVLGTQPLLGRYFTFEEQTNPAGADVVVLGYGLWMSEFGGDSAIVGQRIVISGQPVTVIGVLPKGFTGIELERVDLWQILQTKVGPAARHWGNGYSSGPAIVGRLRAGVTAERAALEATSAHRRTYNGSSRGLADSRISARPLHYGTGGGEATETRIARWLIGLSVTVLLAACANIVNLQLARGVRRRREMAVRVTLGAGRARLIRLLVINSLTLSAIGGLLGLIVAFGTGSVVRRVLLPNVDWTTAPVDTRLLFYTIAAATLTGLLTGVLPALAGSRVDLSTSLKTGTREGGGTRSRVRDGLVVAQAAMGMMLLVGAGLFVRSVQRVQAADLGLDAQRIILVSPRWRPFPTGMPEAERALERARRNAFAERVTEQLGRLPSVEQVATALAMPFDYSMAYSLTLPGRTSLPTLPGGFTHPDVSAVSPSYFATVGTRIVRGRAFEESDRGSHVAVVSETMARLYWPGRAALGECMYLGKGGGSCIRVIGIAHDARRNQIEESPRMHYYVPIGQEEQFSGRPALVVRPRGDIATATTELRSALHRIDPSIRFVDVTPLRDQLEPQTRSWRIGALVFSLFALLALIVAAVGTFGVVAYVIEQRRHEIGVRVALGARAAQIVALMFRGSVLLTAAGITLGAAAVVALSGRISPMLFETSALDPVVIGAVGGLLLIVAATASLIPALRAPRVDPMEALRGD